MRVVEHLLEMLEKQQQILLRLLELVREERSCILNSRLDQLDRITQEQVDLLHQQETLSPRIISGLQEVGKALNASGHLSLARISEYLEEPAADQARKYHKSLTSIAEEVQQEGQVNWQLAQHALKYVDFTLKLIGQAKEGTQTYSLPSQENTKPMQLLLDQSA
jgi:flagellar biosynthesis/type III secretory pathway chaperone